VLLNPGAGSADGDALPTLACERWGDNALCRTTSGPHVADEAAAAAREGYETLAVAGGDGTISLAVTGLMRARDAGMETLPTLLLLPLGTGNDLVRSLGLPEGHDAAIAMLEAGRRRPLDVIRWRLEGEAGVTGGYAVNVIAGGFSSRLQVFLTPELKRRWGPLAYLRAAAETATELQPHHLRLSVDEAEAVEFDALNVVVASARYAGGGISVAPGADPSDGVLDVVATLPGGVVDIAALGARLMSGDVLKSDLTRHLKGGRVIIETTPDMPFNVDGDWTGSGRLQAEIVPAALEVWVPEAHGRTGTAVKGEGG